MAQKNIQEIWGKATLELKKRVNDQVFTAWFDPITPVTYNGKDITLAVPSVFFKEWLVDKYSGLLKLILYEITGSGVEINYIVTEKKEAPPTPDKKESKGLKKSIIESLFHKQSDSVSKKHIGLNQKYTFDSFVVGPSNRFAHAAFLAVSESPAKAYNPLFIYGGVGLGKTHLMHALGNKLCEKSKDLNVVYMTSEAFTNQLISAIQTRSTTKFRQRYRSVNVLLIDDIHFIAGKEATQEEFFHTFNALYDAHRQIVISSDRSPKDIPTLEERLVSRFGWGLVTDIQLPDFETRVAILRKKSELETVPLPNDVLFFLGEHVKTNIRELEGALIRVVAYAKLTNSNISVDLAKEVLKGMIKEVVKNVHIETIQKKVADYFNIRLQDMKTKKRTQNIVYPRQIAMYLSRDLTNLSLPEIGGYFGGRDHTTVIHACNKIEKDIKVKHNIREMVEHLALEIKT